MEVNPASHRQLPIDPSFEQLETRDLMESAAKGAIPRTPTTSDKQIRASSAPPGFAHSTTGKVRELTATHFKWAHSHPPQHRGP